MTNTPQRKLRIQTYIEKLQQGVDLPSHGYPRFFLETPTCEIEDPETGSLSTVDKPLLPKELENIHLDNTHGVVLPNSNRLFYCTSSLSGLVEILKHDIATEIFVASSWQDLYESDYKFWPFVFVARAVRQTVTGGHKFISCRFSELQPGDVVGEIFPFFVLVAIQLLPG